MQYKDLKSSYDASLAEISSLEKKVSDLRAKAEYLEKNQSKPKSKYEIAFDQISNLEQDLCSKANVSGTQDRGNVTNEASGNENNGEDMSVVSPSTSEVSSLCFF